MSVHPSGYYAWKASPHSPRAREDQQAQGERSGKHRVARLMKQEGLRSQTGYHRRPGHYSGHPAVVASNHLQRQFTVEVPNKAWVTDITYIRTHEDGRTWLWCSTCSRDRSLAGRCNHESIESWC